MKKQHCHALISIFTVVGLAAVPTFAIAIENAQEAIVTPAYEKSMRTMEMMNKLDANGDHMVSKEEGEAYFTKLFQTLDRNHDGVLDRTEWVGAAEDKEVVSLSTGGYARALSSMDMMKMVDTDGDHTVSKDEFIKAHEALFNKMAGGQGVIDVQHWVSGHFPK